MHRFKARDQEEGRVGDEERCADGGRSFDLSS